MRKIFFVAALITSSQLFAQEDSTSKTMNEVVITASKFPQKLSSTGKHLTIITKEQILQSGGKDLSQVLNETAGIVINGAGSNPGKDKSVFMLGATSAYTLILLDGVPLNDPTGVGGTFDIRLLSLENIDRIEILKGSQSTLYGSNAVAGVINIISKKRANAKPQLNGLVTYGSFNSLKANAGVGQKTKGFEYDINYVYNSTNGISEAKDTTGKAGFDKDGFTEHALQTSFGINISDQFKVSPYCRYTKFKGGYDADAFTDAPNHFTGSLANAGVRGHYNYKTGSVQFNYGYDNTKRDYVGQYGEYKTDGKFNNAEVYTDAALSKSLKLLAGFNYQTYKIKEVDTVSSIISPYASFFLKNKSGWSFELGGRFNHHNKYGNNFTYSFNPSYLIHQQVKLFSNITSGFRAPSITELFGPYGADPNLKPEKSQTQELGIQSSLLKNKIDFTITTFNRVVNNVIIYGLNGYENRDKQHDHGAEVELNYEINHQLKLKLTYDYVDGNITQKIAGKDTSFYNLIRRPKNNIHAFLTYGFDHFVFNPSLQITGKRIDTYYDPVSFLPSQIDLKSYALLNFYASYSFCKNKQIVFVDAKNITSNKKYYEVYGFGVAGFNINFGIRFQL